jgi:2-keto-3-deoxy-L-rhamnonate aldolase RhmA/glutathione peroxidase-family protein
MSFSNPLRRLWSHDRPAFGVFAGLGGTYATEVVAAAGPDWVCIDLQHGVGGFDALADQIGSVWAGGSVPLVRTPAADAWQIGKALDAGALGVIVPLVESGEDAAAAVAACRYPPAGRRSWGPGRIARIAGTDPAQLAAEVVCLVMVETRAGLDHLDEIAATPGLDGIFVGPSDLALALGLPPALSAPGEHAAAVEQIRAACERNGIVAGIYGGNATVARERAAAGFRMITAASDAEVLARGIRSELAGALRGALFSGLTALDGGSLDAESLEGRAVLVVNVASKCGLTPQYEGLERLQQRFGGERFTVLGVPCNQFSGQEPGTPEEILSFCSTTYGTSFPLTAKLDVNGRHRHPLYQRLTAVPDAAGEAGEVEWNFEKFVVSPAGEIVARFRPPVEPEDERIVAAIEQVLA